MLKTKFISGLALTAALFCPVVFADSIDFPVGQTSGFFNCTVNSANPFATIDIDTKSIEAKGFCAGQPNVLTAGHLKGLPASELKDHYFEIKKDLHESGTITVTSSSGTVTCSNGKGEKTKAFGEGGFC